METALNLKVEIESVWATPREGMSLFDLANEMMLLGNTVSEFDETNNRLRVKHNG